MTHGVFLRYWIQVAVGTRRVLPWRSTLHTFRNFCRYLCTTTTMRHRCRLTVVLPLATWCRLSRSYRMRTTILRIILGHDYGIVVTHPLGPHLRNRTNITQTLCVGGASDCISKPRAYIWVHTSILGIIIPQAFRSPQRATMRASLRCEAWFSYPSSIRTATTRAMHYSCIQQCPTLHL